VAWLRSRPPPGQVRRVRFQSRAGRGLGAVAPPSVFHHRDLPVQPGGRLFSFWMFLVALLPETMLMTWVDNHIQRSILSAVLFHFMESFTSELVTLTKQAGRLSSAPVDLAALVVTMIWGPGMLKRTFVSKGSVKAFLLWIGILLALIYSYVIYAFAVHFNSLFLVYVAILGLSFTPLLAA
jgi:hypothetical protein